MRIDEKGADLARAEALRGARPAESPRSGNDPVQPAAAAGRTDSVQISDAGRALASQVESAGRGEDAGLSPERVDAVRRRILEGAYDSLQVVEETARRMLQSGEI